MANEVLSIGIDVSRAELVIACFDEARPIAHLPNHKADIRRWLKALPGACRIGVEATGTYHRLLADMAVAAGHTVFVLNPREVAHYLKSLRSRGKTDVLDARGIARYVHNETAGCHAYLPSTVQEQAIRTLIQRRHETTKHRDAMRMSFADIADCGKAMKTLLASFDALIADIDATLQRLVRQNQEMETGRALLATICGVGPLVSTAYAVRLSHTPYANSDALVAAIGYDPRPKDSGQHVGRRFLSKRGNPEERRLIYMAAVAACRNPVWQSLREKLLAKGWSNTAAYCIIARKLLRIMLAVWKSGKPYQPQLVGVACGKT